MSAADLYISVDIEADGPIPGPYSMLSFGLAVAGRFDGSNFQRLDPRANNHYAELRPISDDFDSAALRVSGLDRQRLLAEGAPPREAMHRAAAWIGEQAADDNPVLVGYPIVYDWLFFYWYLRRFGPPDLPIGFSSALDMKTVYQQKAGVLLNHAGKDELPAQLRANAPHTHHARDDAIEQAELFANLFTWRPPH